MNYWPIDRRLRRRRRRARSRHRRRRWSSSALGILAAATFEWAIRAWAERATGDPAVNRASATGSCTRSRSRCSASSASPCSSCPISRILLAIPKGGAYIIFGVVPAVILLVGWLIAARPKLNRNLVAGLLRRRRPRGPGRRRRSAPPSGPATIEEHHEEEDGEDEEHRRPRPADRTGPVGDRGAPPMTRPDFASAEGMGDTRTVMRGWLRRALVLVPLLALALAGCANGRAAGHVQARGPARPATSTT